MNALHQRIRLLHCITSLEPDGAQQMLLKMCQELNASGSYDIAIVNLRHPTEFCREFEALGVKLYHLRMRRALPSISALWKLVQVIRIFSPQIVQGWMYHGNLAAYLARACSAAKPLVVWNVRKALSSIEDCRPLTRLVFRLGAFVSRRVSGVIYCGDYVAKQHSQLGFNPRCQYVIPNGFSLQRFKSSKTARQRLRRELSVSGDCLIVGIVGRSHPDKDQANFIKAAARVESSGREIAFVLIGRGVNDNIQLRQLALELGLQGRVFFLGERADVADLLPGFDVYCLSSVTERFPNTLGEAMACEVPCVSTDVGACREALGDCGILVPRRDPQALAEAISQILSLSEAERQRMGRAGRERVEANYSLSAVAAKYDSYYRGLLGLEIEQAESIVVNLGSRAI